MPIDRRVWLDIVVVVPLAGDHAAGGRNAELSYNFTKRDFPVGGDQVAADRGQAPSEERCPR